MNFSQIDTVADLINANKLDTPEQTTEKLLAEILNMDPAYGLQLSKRVIAALARYHHKMAMHNQEAGDVKYASIWSYDYCALNTCYDILDKIVLHADDSDD